MIFTDVQKPFKMLILGGCRSGKSSFAEQWVSTHFKDRKTFVATLEVQKDPEMAIRVELHRRLRGSSWLTLEEPFDLCSLLVKEQQETEVFLVDCLTLWLTNLMLRDFTDEQISSEVGRLVTVLESISTTVVLVANEVGLGIVPENAMARRFRDLAGWTNQQVARACEKAVFMAAGYPLIVKDT